MAALNYLDFDLLIERSQTGYTARVLNSPAGQASTDFDLPFSDLELENFLLRVGRTQRGARRMESPEMAAAKDFGGRLFEAVFDASVRGCLRSSLDEANRQEAGLRIRIRMAGVPELSDLPWEYLYNPTLNRFLVLSAETPLVRFLDLPERIQPLAVKPPIRVLAMISSPSDYPALDVEREWAKLKESLSHLEDRGLLTLERLEQATLMALQRRLRRAQYHIFHFVGHGTFDEQTQDGMLLLEDEGGRGRPVSGQYLGTLMHDERTLRLAILNACEGARTSRTDPFAGTAHSLVQQGIPAVIAMQFEITDEAAIALAQEFYSALADGYPVDAALAEARKAIYAQGNDVEWGKPVLYLRSPDGRIFDIERVSEAERKQAQITALHHEAQRAITVEDWATAIEKLEAVLALDPANAEASAALNRARRAQELATLYAKGREHYDAGRWDEALEFLRRVRNMGGDYKDVAALVSAAEQQAMPRQQPVPVPRPTPSKPNRWLRVGVPLAVVLLLLSCCGGYAAYKLLFPPSPQPAPVVPGPGVAGDITDTPVPTPTHTPKPAGFTPTPTPRPAPPTPTPFPVVQPESQPAELVLFLGGGSLNAHQDRLYMTMMYGVPWADLTQMFFPDQESYIHFLPGDWVFLANQVEFNPEMARAVMDETGLSEIPVLFLFAYDDEQIELLSNGIVEYTADLGFRFEDVMAVPPEEIDSILTMWADGDIGEEQFLLLGRLN